MKNDNNKWKMADKILLKYYQEKVVPQTTIDFLNSLSKLELGAVTKVITSLNPSSNSLRGILELLKDIKQRDTLDFSEILQRANLDSICSLGTSHKIKQSKLRETLERMRYPEKFKLETELNLLVESIKKEHGISIELPEELEGDQLSLNVNFRDALRLEKLSDSIRAVSSSDSLKRIFAILNGEE